MSYFGEFWEVGGGVWVSAPLKKCEKCAGDCDYLWLSAAYALIRSHGPVFECV